MISQQTMFSEASNSGAVAGGSSRHVKAGDEAEVDPRLSGASVEILKTMPRRIEECMSQFGRLEAAAER